MNKFWKIRYRIKWNFVWMKKYLFHSVTLQSGWSASWCEVGYWCLCVCVAPLSLRGETMLGRCTHRFRRQRARWLLSPAAPAPPQSTRFSQPREEAFKEKKRKAELRSRAAPASADGHSRDFTSCTEQFSFLQLLRRRRRERGCGASDTYVCKAALVAFMRFLSVIFSNINKALVSCPCGGKNRRKI